MAFINKQDTNGSKAALLEGELGYDKQGGDRGRVYVGTNVGNIGLAKKSEADSKLPLTGGTISGDLTISGSTNASTLRTNSIASPSSGATDMTINSTWDIIANCGENHNFQFKDDNALFLQMASGYAIFDGYVQAAEFRGDGSQLTNVAKDITSTIFSGSSNTVYPLAAWQGGEFMSLDKYVQVVIRWSVLSTSNDIYNSSVWVNPVQQGYYSQQGAYKYTSSKWWVPYYNGDTDSFSIHTYTASGFGYASEGYIREIIVIGEDVAS
jgi:hypothetical protein